MSVVRERMRAYDDREYTPKREEEYTFVDKFSLKRYCRKGANERLMYENQVIQEIEREHNVKYFSTYQREERWFEALPLTVRPVDIEALHATRELELREAKYAEKERRWTDALEQLRLGLRENMKPNPNLTPAPVPFEATQRHCENDFC